MLEAGESILGKVLQTSKCLMLSGNGKWACHRRMCVQGLEGVKDEAGKIVWGHILTGLVSGLYPGHGGGGHVQKGVTWSGLCLRE